MKKVLFFFIFIQCVYLFPQLPADIDESRLAGTFSLSVLKTTVSDNSCPEGIQDLVSRNIFESVSGIRRFSAGDYSDYLLHDEEIEEFLSFLKRKKLLTYAARKYAPGKTENFILEYLLATPGEDIRNEFGNDAQVLAGEIKNIDKMFDYEFREFPVTVLDKLLETRYLLVSRVSEYTQGCVVEREEEVTTEEDDDGNETTYIKTTITFEGVASFQLHTLIIDTWEGVVVSETMDECSGTSSDTEEYLREEKEETFVDSILGILGAIFGLDSESKMERKLDQLKEERGADAGDDAARKARSVVRDFLIQAKVFHVDTVVLKVDGKDVYLNKGRIWDVSVGSEFVFKQGKKNEMFLRIKKSAERYSIGRVIWGIPEEETVLDKQGFSFINWEIRSGITAFYHIPDFDDVIDAYRTGGTVPQEMNIVPSAFLSLWIDFELGYHFLFAMDAGFRFPSVSNGAFVTDIALGPGARLFMEKFTFDIYVMGGYNILSMEKSYDNADALVLGLTTGTDDIDVTISMESLYIKPVVGISYFLSPWVMCSLKTEYRINFTRKSTTITMQEKSADDHYLKESVRDVSYNFDGFSVTLGLLFRM